MGEKPLSIDEAPQPVTVATGGPLGGFDTPPPAAAATINTTRSNIRNQGAVAHEPATEAGAGAGAVADQARGTEQVTSDAGLAIKEQGVLKDGHGSSGPIGPVKTGDRSAPLPPGPSDVPPPITDGSSGSAVGPIRPGSGSPGPTYPPIPDGGNAAVAPAGPVESRPGPERPGPGRPVPAVGGVAVGPGRPGPGPTYPNYPPPDNGPPTHSAGRGSPAGVAAEGDPIPGMDVKLGKNPGGLDGGARPEGGGSSPPPDDSSPPPYDNDTAPSIADGGGTGTIVHGPDGSTFDFEELPSDENVMEPMEEEDVEINLHLRP